MKDFNNYTSRIGYVLSKQLQLSWRLAMVVVAVFLFMAPSIVLSQSITSFAQYANKNKEWIPGILQSSKSNYYEGSSTLQRLVFVGVPRTNGNQHELTFKVLATKSGINAYDFVTGYDQAFKDFHNIVGTQIIGEVAPGNTFDPSDQADMLLLLKSPAIPNPATASIIESLYLTASANKIIATPPSSASYSTAGRADVASAVAYYDGGLYPTVTSSPRGVQLYGNAAITFAELIFNGYSGTDPSTGDNYGLYTLRWTSASTNLMVLMAGHLSLGSYAPYPELNYGAGKGSSSISGGPYHFKLELLDGASLGNQDNQIQSGSIAPPPNCSVSLAGPVCVGTITTHTAPLTTGATYKWTVSGSGELVDGSTPPVVLSNPYSSSSNTIRVRATSGGSGTYNIQVEITASGRTSTCNTNVSVDPASVGGAAASPQTVCTGSAPANDLTLSGYTGTVLKWQRSTTATFDAGTVSDIANSNSATLSTSQIGNLTVDTWFRAVVQSGVCAAANSTPVKISVDPNNTVDGPGSTTACINTAITNITHNTTGATDIGTPSGLPNGVSAVWANNVITISGTPTESGIFNYSIPLIGGCGSVSALGTITVEICVTNEGCTPGYWKNRKESWNSVSFYRNGVLITSDVKGCVESAANSIRSTDISLKGQLSNAKFSKVFNISNVVSLLGRDVTLLEALGLGDGSGYTQLARASTAGLLNACSMGYGLEVPATGPYSGLSISEYIVKRVHDIFVNGTREDALAFAYLIDQANNAVCMLNNANLSATASTSLKGIETTTDQISAYPTPFSDRAIVEFRMAADEDYVVNLYDMKGSLVKQLKAGSAKVGELQQVEVDGQGLGEGLYIARMISDSGARSVKLLLKRE